MKMFINRLTIICSLFALTACGGGGGDSSPSTEENGENEIKIFSLTLSDVTVRRVSNDEQIPVDVAGIGSGELTLDR